MYLLLRIVPIQGRKFTLWNYCYSNCARARFVIIFLPSVIAISIYNTVPCTCGKDLTTSARYRIYANIGETKRHLETWLKEHKEACIRGQSYKSAIAEHIWTEDHPINWNNNKIYCALATLWSW